MKSNFDLTSFYKKVIDLIVLNDYESAINCIENSKRFLDDDELALACLNCGFLYDKLGKHAFAIEYFSEAIYSEGKLDILDGRSKDISFDARSNSRYKNGDYKGAIEDKRQARNIRLMEDDKISNLNIVMLDFKNIIMGSFSIQNLETKYKILIEVSKTKKNNYDLIDDYLKVINKKRREDIIHELELKSEHKYKNGDYKGSIRAMRRSEKYY